MIFLDSALTFKTLVDFARFLMFIYANRIDFVTYNRNLQWLQLTLIAPMNHLCFPNFTFYTVVVIFRYFQWKGEARNASLKRGTYLEEFRNN